VEIAVVANSNKRILVMEILEPGATFDNHLDTLLFRDGAAHQFLSARPLRAAIRQSRDEIFPHACTHSASVHGERLARTGDADVGGLHASR
jgi:hypothetical protein